MKKNHLFSSPGRLLFFALAALLFSGCDKENTSRVKYEVRCPGGCQVVYKSSTFTNEVVEGNWSVSFRMDNDDFFFLSATKTTVIGNVTVTVSIDGESVAVDQTSLPYGTAVVEGPIDRP